MEIFSHPDIEEIIKLETNSKCFDCGSEKSKWASLNNGIFLCLKCVGIHRNFGLNISLIRSLEIDLWDEKQILYLKKGGNENFKNFLIEYDISLNSSIELKYKSKASDYYRKKLKNIVEKITNPNYICEELIKPDKKTGNELLEIKINSNEISNEDLISSSNNNKPIQDETFFNFMGNLMKSTGSLFIEKSKDVKNKIEEMNIIDNIKNVGFGTVNFIQKSGNYLIEKTQNIYQSNIIQGITNKAEEGINFIVDKTKSLLNQNEKIDGKKDDIQVLSEEKKGKENNNNQNEDYNDKSNM